MKVTAGLTALATFAATVAALPAAVPLRARGGSSAAGSCENPGRAVWIVTEFNEPITDYYHWSREAMRELGKRLTSASEATASNKADKLALTGFGRSEGPYKYHDWFDLSDPDDNGFQIALENTTNNLWSGTNPEHAMEWAMNSMKDRFHVPAGLGCFVIISNLNVWEPSLGKWLQQMQEARKQGYRVHLLHTRAEKHHPIRVSSDNPDTIFGKAENSINSWLMDTFTNHKQEKVELWEQYNRVRDVAISTGGVYQLMENEADAKAWVDNLFKTGLTDSDGKCVEHEDFVDGSETVEEHKEETKEDKVVELVPSQESHGLCSKNAQTVFTYSPKQSEKIAISIALTSKDSPVNIEATYLNTASGETKTVTVNKDSAQATLDGQGAQGENVKVTIKTSNADSQKCEYSVSLKADAQEAKPSTTVPPPSSSATPSATPSTSPVAPPSASVPAPSSSAAPAPSSSSAAPSPSTAPTECPTPEAVNTTITTTVVETVTGSASAQPSASYCVCKCDVPGAKPWPKFEL